MNVPVASPPGSGELPKAPQFAAFALGFRPFYLLAGAFGALSIGLWAVQLSGRLSAAQLLSGSHWHAHEMLFGYTLAVITGFLFTAVRNWTQRPTPTGAPHALTIGVIGGMTLGMMTRTALGHTGRPLAAGRAETACYALIQLAAAARVLLPITWPAVYLAATLISGVLWSLAFAIFTAAYWPILTRPRADGRAG
jgi:uncharacterized protein involved in response to NO